MSKQSYKKPDTLRDVAQELAKLHVEIMADRAMCVQVSEAANALGKFIGASKAHLEACKTNKQKISGEWEKVIFG